MKKNVFILSFLIISLFSMAQSEGTVMLEDYVYDNSFGLNRWIDSANKEKMRRDAEEKAQRAKEALLAALRREQQQQEQQAQQKQQRLNQQIRNQQIAAINRQKKAIQQRNRAIQRQNMAVRQQQMLEAERQRKEDERRKEQQKATEREQERQRVTQATYQRLGAQTRAMQDQAAYTSGVGADIMYNNNHLLLIESQQGVREGTVNDYDRNVHLPEKNYVRSHNGTVVIDPNRPFISLGQAYSPDLVDDPDEIKRHFQNYYDKLEAERLRAERFGIVPTVVYEDEETRWTQIREWTHCNFPSVGRVMEWGNETWQNIREEGVKSLVLNALPDRVSKSLENAKDQLNMHTSVFQRTKTFMFDAIEAKTSREQIQLSQQWERDVRKTVANHSGKIFDRETGYNPYISGKENVFNASAKAGSEYSKTIAKKTAKDYFYFIR